VVDITVKMILSTPMPKSISKIGRPKTYRVPVLVRIDKKALKTIDRFRRCRGYSRPEAVRVVLGLYFSCYIPGGGRIK
jgi:hypothetical protein